jgi:muramoyltetrapeptide carboxypeptidase
MIRPPFLKPGDTIAIVATGRRINAEDVDLARNTFIGWGLKVEIAPNIFSRSHSYLAGSDKERLDDFNWALDNPSVKCIACARGGYGTTRIVDQLQLSSLSRHPKWIVGFSDVTALHLKLESMGVESIHGTMPVLFKKEDSKESMESLRRVLFGAGGPVNSLPSQMNRSGIGRGKLIGGNLSLIVDSLGTSSEPDTTNKVLLIEEVDEYRYKIDRMLNQLKRSGKLQNLSGLVVGHMTGILDTDVSFGESVEQIISAAVKEYKFPVAFGFPSGHENPNISWIHGAESILEVNHEGTRLSLAKTNT